VGGAAENGCALQKHPTPPEGATPPGGDLEEDPGAVPGEWHADDRLIHEP
jgi:hypothetical protein